jgi:AraC family transcriptional activator of pobA
MKNLIPIYDIENFKAYKNEGILVSRFGPYAKQHQHLHSAHRHSFFHLVFFTEGTGTQQIDFKKFEVKSGLIYFMVPGQVHRWDFETEPDGYLLNFSSTYLSSFLNKPDYLEEFPFFSGRPNAQVLELSPIIQEKITSIFEEMLSEAEPVEAIADDLVRTLLLKLLITVGRVSGPMPQTQANAYSHTLLRSFQKLIETNYSQLRLPKQYAELLYITPNHLNALCNDLLGISAGALIRDRVMLEAKRLLINLELMVAEIADQLNFADQSYFIKFFKKYEGITPEKFRKLNTSPHGNNTK